jgi:hypothetical protein
MNSKRRNLKYILIAVAIFLFTSINIPYEISIPYTATEIYIVDEPHTDFNYYNYTVNESYIEDVPIDYIVLDAQYKNYVSSPPSYLWIEIKNIDNKSGYFNVDFHITTKTGISIPSITKISSTGNYISSGEIKAVKISFNETITEFKYDIVPPTKEVSKYRNITTQRTETKYRKVQKTRGVIKLKNESTSVLLEIISIFSIQIQIPALF